jgi:inosine/xanthosine triphosphatase
MKIIVASQNPVKVQAVRAGFERMFPGLEIEIEMVSAASGVSDQPAGNAETLQGARNRARNAYQQCQQADFWAGVEGGIEDEGDGMAAFAWVVVLGREPDQPEGPARQGSGRTGTFYLPPAVSDLVRQGMELGEADDIVFGKVNSKQANGAVGILTGDVLDRTGLYEQAVILALIPFKNPALYTTL